MQIKSLVKKVLFPLRQGGLLYPMVNRIPGEVLRRKLYSNDYSLNELLEEADIRNLMKKLFNEARTNNDIMTDICKEITDNDYMILKLRKSLPGELKIVLGASSKAQQGWIPTEIEFLDISKASDWEALFNTGSISRILSEHVWEHLTEEGGAIAAKNCFKYLKMGGHIRVAVPDGFHCSKEYVEYVKPGGHGAGSDDHKVLYTYKTLRQVFESAGFRVRPLEYWDENGEFHYNAWDIKDGFIERSRDHDERNKEQELSYTSLIIDGVKDA